MKKLLTIIVLFISLTKAQGVLTQEEINDFYISPLDSTNYDLSSTINQIISLNLIETLPKIEQNFWRHSCWNQQWFLEAMLRFNSAYTKQYCLMLLDSLRQHPNERYNVYTCSDLLLSKVKVIEILYELQDYSQVNEVFELIEREKLNGSKLSIGVLLLPYIYKYRTDYKERAKQEMLNALNSSNDEYSVFAYSLILTQAYGEGELSEVVELFQSITNPQAKRGILEFYFSNYEDKFDLRGLIKESLPTETNDELRLYYTKVLLLGFATPSDYAFVKNYLNSENNDTIRTLIEYELKSFLPPPIEKDDTLEYRINNLIDYVDSVSVYTWLGDQRFKDELQSILQSAKSNLQVGDSLACAVKVKAFQDLVDNVYKDSLNPDPRFVTLEGWKFLYWNAQYILDRLPQLPVNTDIEEMNPAMSLVNPGSFTMEVKGTGFTTSSVVYFNGNARTTNFVADTLLTAEIQSSDVSAAGNYPVWVSDGTTNSDTLTFSVVSTLPKPVIPVLDCVRNNGDGTYTAFFGYENQNEVSIYIPIHSQNKISPAPWDRGQPGVFRSGRWEKVFSVSFSNGNIIWHLLNRIATASSNSALCN